MKNIILVTLLIALFMVSCTTAPEGKTIAGEEPMPAIDGDKICALTFDDGPDVNKTKLVLDILEREQVPGTFFVIGQLINNNTAPVLKRAVALGSEIGNHSWSWSGLNSMSAADIRESVGKTTDAIEKYAGVTPHFFRPPNLATSQTMFETIDYPFASGIVAYDWDGNTSDQERANHVLKGVRDGAIILLHDVQPHQTHKTLEILIPELRKQGYTFVTLSELFERKGVDPGSKTTGMWTVVN